MQKAKKSTSKVYRKQKLKKSLRRAERLANKYGLPIYQTTDKVAENEAQEVERLIDELSTSEGHE